VRERVRGDARVARIDGGDQDLNALMRMKALEADGDAQSGPSHASGEQSPSEQLDAAAGDGRGPKTLAERHGLEQLRRAGDAVLSAGHAEGPDSQQAGACEGEGARVPGEHPHECECGDELLRRRTWRDALIEPNLASHRAENRGEQPFDRPLVDGQLRRARGVGESRGERGVGRAAWGERLGVRGLG
jgi:hypothetical protein